MRRRRPWIVATVVLVAVALGVVVARHGRGDSGAAHRPSGHELSLVRARLAHDEDALARAGIYVIGYGMGGRPCVDVDLANPTAANREYLRRRYGGLVCVSRQPAGGPPLACADVQRVADRGHAVVVPSLIGSSLYGAERRIVGRGLTFTVGCLGVDLAKAVRPPAYAPEALVRITAQCPRAGQRVSRGSEVALNAVAHLPGGYVYVIGALDEYNTGGQKPCRDGRNARRPLRPPGRVRTSPHR